MAHGQNGSPLRVLVVEDNGRIRELEREILEQLGYDVTVAANERDALKRLDQFRYDLLVTDIHLSSTSNGIELARLAKHKKLKTLLIGGDLDRSLSADFREIADDILRKPFRPRELEKSVAALIGLPDKPRAQSASAGS